MKVEKYNVNQFACEIVEMMGIDPGDVYDVKLHFSSVPACAPEIEVKMFIKDQNKLSKILKKYSVEIQKTTTILEEELAKNV